MPPKDLPQPSPQDTKLSRQSSSTSQEDAKARPPLFVTEILPHSLLEAEQRAPYLNWRKAVEVPWTECVRDPQRQPEPTADQEAYFRNNKLLRLRFLELLADMQAGKVEGFDVFKSRFAQLHRVLILGENDTGVYTKPDQQKKIGERSPSDIAGNFGEHPEEWDDKLRDLQVRLVDFLDSENAHLPQIDRVSQVGQIFFNSLNGFPKQFAYGNNSFNMNLVNGLLRLSGLNGISHGDLDVEFMVRMNEPHFPARFIDQVRTTNQSLR